MTATVVYLGLFPTADRVPVLGLRAVPHERRSAGRDDYAVPGIAVLMSWLLLAEVPAPLALAGGAVSLAGVALTTLPLHRPGRP